MNIRTTDGVSDQYIGRCNSGTFQCDVEFFGNLPSSSGFRPWIRSCCSGVLVGDDLGELGDFRLHLPPTFNPSAQARLQHDGWTALSCGTHTQTVTTNVNFLGVFAWADILSGSGASGETDEGDQNQ
jgi:hypothetical protein